MDSGILIINKPTGPTSHDVVDEIRKITGIKQVGHAGTLDPFAEGVLIILIGKATKLQSKFMGMPKTYVATLRLGAISDTYDSTGVIKSEIRNPKSKTISKFKTQNILNSFIGKLEQTPPIYSAIKIRGKKACELARKGIKPKLKPRKVKIYNIKLLEYKWPASRRRATASRGGPRLEIEVKCGKGTYVRSLAHDIGQKLGCGAYLEELTRTKIGKFNIKKSIKIDELNSKNWTNKMIPVNI